MTSPRIIPSYPAPSFDALYEVLQRLRGCAPAFQVDIVELTEGTAPSWPAAAGETAADLLALAPDCADFAFEFDLMVRNPVDYFASASSLSVSCVVVHPEIMKPSLEEVVAAASTHDLALSVASTAATPVATVVEQVEEHHSSVQLMGIATVGQQGQPFDTRVLQRYKLVLCAWGEDHD